MPEVSGLEPLPVYSVSFGFFCVHSFTTHILKKYLVSIRKDNLEELNIFYLNTKLE